jgi:SNF family Na+-dependent transporter
VILAVAGSAVGLGNFLRVPGKAAEYGGAAFMIAYFTSLVLLGLPICWTEWAMGRSGGQGGFNSCPAIFALYMRRPKARYLGVLGVVIPVVIYMYYVNIEAWCLGYAYHFLVGNMNFQSSGEAGTFFNDFIGINENGAAFAGGMGGVGIFLIICFALNFFLIYRGVARGIELFCTWAMPVLMLLALIILVRVLTLGTPDPAKPYNNVYNGLGFMWNPSKVQLVEDVAQDGEPARWVLVRELVGPRAVAEVQAEVDANPRLDIRKVDMWEQLKKPEMWLAAAGQIFFSMSVGFGLILTYASYSPLDDGTSYVARSRDLGQRFSEDGLGGMITLPAGSPSWCGRVWRVWHLWLASMPANGFQCHAGGSSSASSSSSCSSWRR